MKKTIYLFLDDVYIGEARADTIRSKEKWMFQFAYSINLRYMYDT